MLFFVFTNLKIDGYGKVNKISIQGGVIAKSVYGKKGFENYISKNFSQDDIVLYGETKKSATSINDAVSSGRT